jgi:hypothetical protein
MKDDVYVFQLFDNNFHMVRSKKCVYLPHSKDASRNYLVYGEAQFEMFCACLLLLKIGEGGRGQLYRHHSFATCLLTAARIKTM